jgi:hypothetical protein
LLNDYLNSHWMYLSSSKWVRTLGVVGDVKVLAGTEIVNVRDHYFSHSIRFS